MRRPSGSPVATNTRMKNGRWWRAGTGHFLAFDKAVAYTPIKWRPSIIEKRGIVSPGTEHTAIWPLDVAGLYTVLSMKPASVQDFAGFVPAIGGSSPPPDPASLISVIVFLL